ncbi:MAG: HDOD domain-containing protein [Planctomycetaceae bacterium]
MMTATLPASEIESAKARILQGVNEFTMIPAAAMEAMQVGRNPACSLKEYARTIERDHRLMAEILGMANSWLNSGGAPVTTLLDAVNRLGLVKCQELILATCTAGLMKKLPFQHTQIRQQLWRHGYLTAVVCMHLNQKLRLRFNGEEFTAGLMHDLGRCLIAATVPDLYQQVVSEIGTNTRRTLEVERSRLGTDHCEIGREFAERNKLPAPLVAAIQHHHAPDAAGEHSTIATVVAAAAEISTRLEHEQPPVDPNAEAVPSTPLYADLARVRDAVSTLTRDFTAKVYSDANKMMA